jgi:hypothetical protein
MAVAAAEIEAAGAAVVSASEVNQIKTSAKALVFLLLNTKSVCVFLHNDLPCPFEFAPRFITKAAPIL